MRIFQRKTFVSKIIGLMILTLFVVACAEQKFVRGNLIRESQLQQIQIGASDKQQVLRVLGSPTVESTFDRGVWYYIGQRRSKDGFYPAELNALEIYIVKFDAADILQDISYTDHNGLRLLSYNDTRTPTRGAELTAIQQLLGNLGRFQAPENQSGVRDLLER